MSSERAVILAHQVSGYVLVKQVGDKFRLPGQEGKSLEAAIAGCAIETGLKVLKVDKKRRTYRLHGSMLHVYDCLEWSMTKYGDLWGLPKRFHDFEPLTDRAINYWWKYRWKGQE